MAYHKLSAGSAKLLLKRNENDFIAHLIFEILFNHMAYTKVALFYYITS